MESLGLLLWLLAAALTVSIAGTNVALAALTAVLFRAAFSRKPVSWSAAKNPAVYALGAYCAAALVVSLAGVDCSVSLRAFYKDIHKLWALALLLLALKARPVPRAYKAFAEGFVFIALAGLLQAALQRQPGGAWVRAHAFVHPVTFGEQIALALLGGLCFFDRPEAGTSSPAAKKATLAFLALMTAALILNQTRGALLGLAAGYAAVCLLDEKLRGWALKAAAAAVAAVLVWEIMPTNGRSLRYLLEHSALRGPGGSFNPYLARYALWSAAWRMFRDHPWTGVGPGNYLTVFPNYFSGTIDGERVWGSAHNLYLHQLAERGVLGFAALMVLLYILAARAWRRAKEDRSPWNLWALAAIAAFLVMNLTEVAFQNEQVTTLALFIWAWAESQPRRREQNLAHANGRVKVFQVLECGGPGGTGNQVAALCNGLDPERFEVSLVFASRDSDAEEYRACAPGAGKAFHVPEMVREISPARDIKAFFKLYRLFRAEAPDVVHAHSSKAGALARLAAKFAGVPRIFYSPHGYGFLQEDRSRAARAVYRLSERSASWIGEIVAVSPSEAELARPLAWGKPVATVCDPYLGELPAPALIRHPGLLVGACGRMTAARNPSAFVNLCQRLTDSRNGLKCVWVGGGEEEEQVRRHLENMNLPGKVSVTGWLAPKEALEKLRGLDVFVHYSRWEGLPNAVLEAMALGLPVVASDVWGNRDAVVHGETGFLAKNEVELLEYCLKLIDDSKLRRKMGDAGRERVLREFSPEKALARLEELYGGPGKNP